MTRREYRSGTSVVPTNAAPRTTGTVVPHDDDGPEDLLPSVPRAIRYDRPDWTSLRPPADSRLQEVWSKLITPVRAVLLACLFLTYAWWRPCIALAVVGTLAVLLWIVVSA